MYLYESYRSNTGTWSHLCLHPLRQLYGNICLYHFCIARVNKYVLCCVQVKAAIRLCALVGMVASSDSRLNPSCFVIISVPPSFMSNISNEASVPQLAQCSGCPIPLVLRKVTI